MISNAKLFGRLSFLIKNDVMHNLGYMKPEDIITVGGQWQVLTFTQESVFYYHKITGTTDTP